MTNYKGLSFSVIGNEKGAATSVSKNTSFSKIGSFLDKYKKLTLSPKKIFNNNIKNIISVKPKLINLTTYQTLGFQANLVGYDETNLENIDKPMSPRLINYVDPYIISGFTKTLFYTEVNSGLKVGDRVFIINGNYDSDLLIKEDKYKRGRDGYKVLYADRCQIVLDIDYTGELPWLEEDEDNFIKVHFIDSLDDFKYVETALTTRGGTFSRRFNFYQNNIVFSNKDYGPVNIWGKSTKLKNSPGFYVRNSGDSVGWDSDFTVGVGFNNLVRSIAVKSDGKILVGGDFTSYQGSPKSNIIRLNDDSTIDFAFISGSGFNNSVRSIVIQSDNKLLIVGNFTSYNGVATNVNKLVRLSSNGALDTSFQTNIGVGVGNLGTSYINKVSLDSSQNIYIGGKFTTWQGITNKNRLLKLNPSGTLDTTFSTNLGTGFNSTVNTIEIQSDGKILVGGDFTYFNSTLALRLVRLNADGTLDTLFTTNMGFGLLGSVHSIKQQVDGKILVGGSFTNFDGQTVGNFIRLNSDGTMDTLFYLESGTGFNGVVYSIELESIGATLVGILVGGSFTNFNGISKSRIQRLNPDGSNDIYFSAGSGFTGGFLPAVYDIAIDNQLRILAGGKFDNLNGAFSSKLARIVKTEWLEITNDFINGNYSFALSPTYNNNNRVKIVNGSFTYSINETVNFKKGYVYKFDKAEEPNSIIGTYSTWKTDVRYARPIISKTNFRDGDFSGVWNVGLFGRQDKEIVWKGDKSTWNTGTLLNSKWIKGNIKSEYSLAESYFSEIDSNGQAFQKTNAPNNNGRGFNFIIDSKLTKTSIDNATLINTNLKGESFTYSVVESAILSQNPVFNINIKKAYFEDTDFENVYIKNSEIRNAKSKNSKFENIKSINSHFKNSYINNSDYISDEVIKILGYDEFTIAEDPSIQGSSHKVYKFYISGRDYNRLNLNDSFYIKGLNVVDGQRKLLNFFDKKFKISNWYEHDDVLSGTESFYKRGTEVLTFLSTPAENEWTLSSTVNLFDFKTSAINLNNKSNYSIDIVYSLYDTEKNPLNSMDFNMSSSPIPYGTSSLSPEIANIIDIKDAYIIDSDFESGLFDRSNWNSGYNINGNNDVNITTPSNEGGFYNLIVSTSSRTITATTTYNFNSREVSEDLLKIGNVVFLNSVNYDTRGKILSVTISNPGTGSITSNDVSLIGSLGSNAEVDITALSIGGVTSISILYAGLNYENGPGLGFGTHSNIPTTTTSGSGTGLTVNITVVGTLISTATINNPGSGYLIGDTVSINPNPTGGPLSTISVDAISNGEIIAATISNSGLLYNVGDILNVFGSYGGQVQVTSATGSIQELPDAYKITTVSGNLIRLKEIVVGTSKLATLLGGGKFYTQYANNRYGYIHPFKITKSFIKSGVFKRSYLNKNLIQNNDLNLKDKDFTNILQFKKLLTSDILYTNNGNILSKASYVQSSFTTGSDYWDDGLFYNSVWNGGIFRKGLIKESSWHDGIFLSGNFYQSRSFNSLPTLYYQYYDVDRVKNYWKDGQTSATISNDRYSWRAGSFNTGEFLKSDWESGEFISGKLYNSKWYSGTFSSGTIGDSKISFNDTQFYNGLIKTAIVENASIYAVDTSYNGLSNSTIVWEDGVFNDGVFGSDIIQYTASNTATWKDGTFNSGEFKTNGKWLTGVFNGGKFTSGFGWTHSSYITQLSTSASHFAWENGEFNGGEFGTGNLGTNSTWWNGEFNDGKFQGRYWQDGVMTAGEFSGSATYSAVGGYNVDGMTVSNAYNFVDSYSQSFYGLWNKGFITNVKDDFIKDKKIFTIVQRSLPPKRPFNFANLNNMLWLSGTFSHPGGKFNNSVWLDGTFLKGKFEKSSFNPWVIRPGDTLQSFNLNDDLVQGSGSCVWVDGSFDDSEFYISQWNNGKFLSGTAFGMVWKNGVSNYMNAYNVFWENGTWRNGNWYGSYLKFDGSVIEPFNKQILFRGMNWSSSSELHVWNIFKEELLDVSTLTTSTASSSTGGIGTGRLFFSGVGGGGGLSTPGINV